jgi:hypothetical protein
MGSVHELVVALQRALLLTNRIEIRSNCRETIAAYSVDKAAEGIARAYEAALSPSFSVQRRP